MQEAKELRKNGELDWVTIPSFYRDCSLMETLTLLDLLRAKLITTPDYKAIFYSHISNETSIAEKKFKIFKPKMIGFEKEKQ